MDMRVLACEFACVLWGAAYVEIGEVVLGYERTAYSSSTQGGIDFGVSSSSSMCSDSKGLVVRHEKGWSKSYQLHS
jgi:hypothetical protein